MARKLAGVATRKALTMCYDLNWQKTSTCSCDRPPPRIIRRGYIETWTFAYLTLKDGKWVWEYPKNPPWEDTYKLTFEEKEDNE